MKRGDGDEKATARSSSKRVPLTKVLDRNIKALIEARRVSESDRTVHQRVVSRAVAMIGSMGFFYFHALFFIAWIVFDHGLFGVRGFHMVSFDRITGIASLEAILLSTLVLINQKSMGELVETREDLDLQMSLITEHEITRILHVVDLIAKEMKIDTKDKVPDIEDAKKDISPEMVLSRIEDLKEKQESGPAKPKK